MGSQLDAGTIRYMTKVAISSAKLQHFGTRMRNLRLRRGMTQSQLSKAAAVARKRIVDIEAGNRPVPTAKTLEKLGAALRIEEKTASMSLHDDTDLVLVKEESEEPTYSAEEVADMREFEVMTGIVAHKARGVDGFVVSPGDLKSIIAQAKAWRDGEPSG